MRLQKLRIIAGKPILSSTYRVGGCVAVFLFIISFSRLQHLQFTGKHIKNPNRIFASNSSISGLSNCFTTKCNTNI